MAKQWKSGWLLGLLLSAIAPLGGASAAVPMVFRHLTVDEGLSQNTVLATLQDSRGFLWIATEDGLDRYDGYTLRHFAHERGSSKGLAGNYIWAVREDRSGDLWIAVKDSGIARFNPRTETFTGYRHDPHDPTSLSSDAARQLLIDRDGKVWIATSGGGVNVLDPTTGHARRLRHEAARPESLSSDVVYALVQDRDGHIWVGTERGLDLWVPQTAGFKHFTHSADDSRSLSSNKVSSLYSDRAGTLWVGTFDGGLNRFDGEPRGFATYTADATDLSRLSNPEVRAILEDSDGRLWVATASGLNLLDRASNKFTRFVHDATDPGSLRVDYVMSLSQDRGGLLWVGTLGGGVNSWNPRSWLFGHVRPSWLANAYAIAFANDSDGRLWVGTQGAGLFRFDPRTGESLTADSVYHTKKLLPDPRVMALLRSSSGDLWAGTMEGGIVRITPDGRARRLRIGASRPDEPRALDVEGVMSLCEAQDGRIWVGTFGGGLAIIDPSTEGVQRVGTDPQHGMAGAQPPATSLAQGPDGIVWVGTDGAGLLALRSDGTVLMAWRHRESDPRSLSSDTVYAVHVDATGRVWIGTDSAGLDQVLGSALNPASVQFRNLSTADGLSGNTIYGIESDEQGALWLSGTRGLVRYVPESGEIRSFHRDHGLQGDEFNFAAHFRLSDGRLVFGGPNGFNLFDPKRVMTMAPVEPLVTLTSIDLKGQPARLDAPYGFISNIIVESRDDVASFEFAALDFAAPEKNQYSYRLRGFDDHWTAPATVRRATYTNLDAGDYAFEVRAASADGVWTQQALQLPVTVRPAPWRSRPAYALYVALTGLLIWGFVATQRAKLRAAAAQAAKLEREVDSRTEELKASNIELERLARAKSDFLARMSHEIRTPMNGIIGMGELLMRTRLTDEQMRLAATVDRSAKSLMQILNDTLDIAKVEAGRLTLASEPFDLALVMTETVELFAAQAHEKGLDLIVAPAPDLDRLVIGDPLRVRQVLINLVGNAVKFTKAGEIVLVADVTDRSENRAIVSLCTRDSGIGMRPDVVARIFDPFTQGDESTTRRFGGTGLGLTICRELVGLMGGTIVAKSESHIGSTFTVTLPMALAEQRLPEAAHVALPAVIVSRRATLSDAVQRQCRLLRVACRRAHPDHVGTSIVALAASGRETVIVDIDSCPSEAARLLTACGDVRLAERCVFLGTSTALAELGVQGAAPAAKTAPKPLSLQTLRTVLTSAGANAVDASLLLGKPANHRLRGSVLIVEDNEVNAAVFEGLLDEIGCSHTTVANGHEAVALAGAESYGAILMDVHMPDMDGWTATGLIRRAEAGIRHTPIIALTADAAEGHRQRCREAGMDDFLAKPLALEDLRAALARWLPMAVDPVPAPAATETLTAETVSRIRGMEHGGRGGLLTRVATLFAESSGRQIEAIMAAVADGNLQIIRAQCHSLKSAAAHVGADRLARLAVNLERAANAADPAQVALLADGLRSARAAAVDALQTELAKGAA
jgi:signal transduction histidine kinase/ligand-binding sensor domain-containing protein/DNA-binding NarL/FixJ family response regulator/HPt (histidine-containing phosphotransfer) domain-containing protein